MAVIANTLFKDKKNELKVISAISDVLLGASTVARGVSAMSANRTAGTRSGQVQVVFPSSAASQWTPAVRRR